ncbi:hypothetical protein [Streptomyces chartreusis]|uniref:hypothetical protein n=1 Tax=Streptomyces chartreusis TaxID=1969 RepID=UPI0036C83342
MSGNESVAEEIIELAAKCIREVNEEIEDIYVEIGISIGVSVGMSFLTLGVSAAGGTARVTMLATRALDAAGRLGKLLRAIGNAFRALYNSGKGGRFAAEGLLNWAGATAGGMITSKLSGKGWEVGTNLTGGLAGATVGTAAGKAVTALGGKEILSGMAGGAAGEMSGAIWTPSARARTSTSGRVPSPVSPARLPVVSAVGPGQSTEASTTWRGLSNDNDFAYAGDRPEHQQSGVDAAFGASTPIAGGVSANTAKDGFDGVDESASGATKSAGQGVDGNHRTATDRIREDFG